MAQPPPLEKLPHTPLFNSVRINASSLIADSASTADTNNVDCIYVVTFCVLALNDVDLVL